MGKTNKERAEDIARHWDDTLLWVGIRDALDKAERRGRRKERKAPTTKNYVVNVSKPFDVERVRALIHELVSTTFDLGTTTYVKLSPEKRAKHYVVLKRRQAALHSLLHELGIDNG